MPQVKGLKELKLPVGSETYRKGPGIRPEKNILHVPVARTLFFHPGKNVS